MLEREAEKQGLSFCSYLEQFILERNNEVKSNAILDKNIIIEPSNNSSLGEIEEEESITLESQLNRLKQTYLDYQKRSIVKQKETESELSDLESENYDLTESLRALEDKIALLQQYDLENESLSFLQKQFPDLSKGTIIKTCLDCCAERMKDIGCFCIGFRII